MGVIKKIIQQKRNQVTTEQEQESLSEIVKDENAEMGLPLNRSAAKKSNMSKVVVLGIGLIAVGAIVAGIIGFAGGDDETVAAASDPAAEVKNMNPNDFNADKDKLALEQAMAASVPAVASDAQSAEIGGESVAADADTQSVVPAETAAAEPALTPAQINRNRRLGGEVILPVVQNTVMNSDSNGKLTAASDSGEDVSDGSGFASRLNPTATASIKAIQRGDLSMLLTKGTNIRCALGTRIITTQPGFTSCQIMRDVYSANGKVLLLERGSRIIGEQTAALLQGQARVFVLWNEVETPNGVRISIASPGAGALGEGGHGAKVNYHFWQRFGGAMLISLISDIGENLSNHSNHGSNNNITYENSSEAAQAMATEALKNSINIPPTGTVNQGTILNILVARDVDFSNVYDIVRRPTVF